AARNALVDMKRKEARVTVVQELPETEDPQPDPTDRLLVKSMLDRLNSELRMPVYLKYYQGLTSTEIGRIMGIPPATVRTRLRVALKLMRAMMCREN
ncbi:MAG: RNA polymerase sigma factor, partial [Oscillospiraceae bacterium]|nr:RNA polymerase sigma factor [Oscillospiraceae bacterium]